MCLPYYFFRWIFLALLSLPLLASAADGNASKDAVDLAVSAMKHAAITGPYTIKLDNKATISLPEGFIYIPAKPAAAYMREIGNYIDDDYFYGLIYHSEINGFISIEYNDAGYIKDDDAKNWNADELLEDLKKGTLEGNKDRKKKGIAPIEIIGWIEKPIWDPQTQRLLWSVASKDIDSTTAPDDRGVNYNTYLLGRKGYFSLDLVTNAGSVEHDKVLAQQILNALAFNQGQRYSDFNASTDKIAEYGLAALIGGVVAKKVGLLAMLGLALVKFWKLTAVAVVAFGAGIRQLFMSKNQKNEDN